MLIASYKNCLMYSAIGVFTDTPDNAVPDWTRAHGPQGFVWQPTAVAFATTCEFGDLKVEIERTSHAQVRAEAHRVIQVPFLVDGICVFDDVVNNYQHIAVEEGQYALVFQHGWGAPDELGWATNLWCVFSFVPDDNPQPVILRADEGIQVPENFVMEAKRYTGYVEPKVI